MARPGHRLGRAVLVVACLVPVACASGAGTATGPDEAVQFLDAWAAGDIDGMSALTVAPSDEMRAAYAALPTDLGIASLAVEPGEAQLDGDVGSMAFEARLGLQGLGTWTYAGSLPLARADGRWAVAWAPAAIHPSLQPGDRLLAARVVPQRAPIYSLDGRLLAVSDAGGQRSQAGASEVVGEVETATAEGSATTTNLTVAPGDQVGTSGLEATHNRELAGRASGEVRRIDASGAVVEVVHAFPGAAPEPLQTSIDLTVQAAAVEAVSTIANPSAIVAIDVPTGAVRAVASGPGGGFDRALNGSYPPGSTFKVVTTVALLANGMDVGSPVQCPADTVAGGLPIRNSGGFGLGQVPFSEAFARSCNTTFALGAEALPDGALHDAAELFGFDVPYSVGVPAVRGSFPETGSSEELVAASIGQGRVEASPLHMASVAAAAAGGTWHAPWIVEDDHGGEGQAVELPEEGAAALPDLMRLAVTEGTGTAVDIPGQDVRGKTGTAEFGDEDPPETHAWFIGFRGDLAFAVLVEGGASGGSVAAPVARTFLDAVPVAEEPVADAD
jgi:hypothetical protein